MMKLLFILIAAFLCISKSLGETEITICTIKPADIPKKWLNMAKKCTNVLEDQVNMEIEAAMTYLTMGAHFANSTVNRPGFSKFFFDAANEERQHAIKLIEYLLMRGQLTNDKDIHLHLPMKPKSYNLQSGLDALSSALQLETKVTESIRNIIITCDKPSEKAISDYHLVDYLTAEFLDEQYKAERDLAGKISTLGKMMQTHGQLGEFLFDKKLLKGEI